MENLSDFDGFTLIPASPVLQKKIRHRLLRGER